MCRRRRLNRPRPRRSDRRPLQCPLPRSPFSALSSSSLHRISSPRLVPRSNSAGSKFRVRGNTGCKCASWTIAGKSSALTGSRTRPPCCIRLIIPVAGCGGWPPLETMTGWGHGLSFFAVFQHGSTVVLASVFLRIRVLDSQSRRLETESALRNPFPLYEWFLTRLFCSQQVGR